MPGSIETIVVVIVGIVSFIFLTRKGKDKISKDLLIKILEDFRVFKVELENLKGKYIANSEAIRFKEKHNILWSEMAKLSPRVVNKYPDIKFFNDTYSNFQNWVDSYNTSFIEDELVRMQPLLSNIDGKSLDRQQSIAVIADEDNTLVLAGAGSGKTLTISAKVKYLVEQLAVKPEEILLISFTAKSAQEMTERIHNKLGIPVTAMTFHKLGLDIITKDNHRPDIEENLSEVINKYFSETVLKDDNILANVVRFYGEYLVVPKDIEEFDTLGEYHQVQSSFDFETLRSKMESVESNLKNERRTLKFEQVRSIEEVMIANFLYLNGVNYEYESRYPYQTDKYRKVYKPDFYLPDYDIYIEHFGITEDFKVPWLDRIEEQKYLDGIQWKRRIHQQFGTKLLETYSYYNKNGVLLSELKNKLSQMGVRFKEIDLKAIYERVLLKGKEEQQFKEFKKLIGTFITLFKSNGFEMNDFYRLEQETTSMENAFLKERTLLFLAIVKPIYDAYQKTLQSKSSIDFNDMINHATKIVREKEPAYLKYKYIIIDEFQDISMGRYRLVKEIKELTGAKVMAVGDDWQSIYRFTGSDLQIFVDFEKYFGFTKTLRIEKTYRNSQQLINIAAKFVMKNPIQLKKNLLSDKVADNPIRIFGYSKEYLFAFEKAVKDIVRQVGPRAEIMVIGRNNFDIKYLIEQDTDKRFILSDKNGAVTLKYKSYPNVHFEFNTVHRSKGLEADNVIVINMKNHLVGFPNKIADDPLLSLVLTDADKYIYAEERRLFYVAITRTRNSTYLIAPESDTSLFVEELVKVHGVHFSLITGEASIRRNPKCPVCKTGVLIIRQNSNDNRTFLGCSNYPSCSETYREVDILKNPIKCNSCGGYMVKRKGPYGEFYGCSNYPICKNSLEIKVSNKTYKTNSRY